MNEQWVNEAMLLAQRCEVRYEAFITCAGFHRRRAQELESARGALRAHLSTPPAGFVLVSTNTLRAVSDALSQAAFIHHSASDQLGDQVREAQSLLAAAKEKA